MAAIIPVIGSVVSGIGSLIEGDETSEAASREALMRDAEAVELERRTRRRIAIERQEGKDFLGTQTSSFAKAGVDLKGSALLTLQDTAIDLEEDLIETQRQADFQVAQIRSEAQTLRATGESAKTAGAFGLGLGILSGAGKALSRVKSKARTPQLTKRK